MSEVCGYIKICGENYPIEQHKDIYAINEKFVNKEYAELMDSSIKEMESDIDVMDEQIKHLQSVDRENTILLEGIRVRLESIIDELDGGIVQSPGLIPKLNDIVDSIYKRNGY